MRLLGWVVLGVFDLVAIVLLCYHVDLLHRQPRDRAVEGVNMAVIGLLILGAGTLVRLLV